MNEHFVFSIVRRFSPVLFRQNERALMRYVSWIRMSIGKSIVHARTGVHCVSIVRSFSYWPIAFGNSIGCMHRSQHRIYIHTHKSVVCHSSASTPITIYSISAAHYALVSNDLGKVFHSKIRKPLFFAQLLLHFRVAAVDWHEGFGWCGIYTAFILN